MKKMILLTLMVLALALFAGCVTTNSGQRENTQELRKSPCASLAVEVLDGQA